MVLAKLRTNTLKINDVAWLLGTDVSTIERWANSGIIKSYRVTNQGEQLFKRNDVAYLLATLGA